MEASEQPPRTLQTNPRPDRATADRDRDDRAVRRHEKILAHPTGVADEDELGRQEAYDASATDRPLPA
jgi:hypothetical protein